MPLWAVYLVAGGAGEVFCAVMIGRALRRRRRELDEREGRR